MELSEMGNINLPKAKDFLGAYVESKKTGNKDKFDKFYKENAEGLKPVDEQIKSILEDKIYKAIQDDAQSTNRLMASMDPLHTVLQGVQKGLRELANVMLEEVPALIKVVKDLTDAVKPAIKPFVEFFGGEMPDGSNPSPLKSISKESPAARAKRSQLSKDANVSDMDRIKESIKNGYVPSAGDYMHNADKNQSPEDWYKSLGLDPYGKPLAKNSLPSMDSKSSRPSPLMYDPISIKVEGSIDLTTPDGTRKIVPLKQTSAPTTKINNGRGIR
jgi:hypothetical protein